MSLGRPLRAADFILCYADACKVLNHCMVLLAVTEVDLFQAQASGEQLQRNAQALAGDFLEGLEVQTMTI